MESLFIGLLQSFFMQRERTAHKNINFYKEGEQLENYTKYKLKSSEELASVLEGKGQSVCDCLQQMFQRI